MVLYGLKLFGHRSYLFVSSDVLTGPCFVETVDVIMFCCYDWGRHETC